MGFNRTAVSSSLTGVSPRPMLMGAPRNAVWAFNVGVSLCVLRCRRPQSRYACFAAWYRSLALNRGHGAPAAWLGAKGTYLICPILRRHYLAPLSLSRCSRFTHRQGKAWKGEAALPVLCRPVSRWRQWCE